MELAYDANEQTKKINLLIGANYNPITNSLLTKLSDAKRGSQLLKMHNSAGFYMKIFQLLFPKILYS